MVGNDPKGETTESRPMVAVDTPVPDPTNQKNKTKYYQSRFSYVVGHCEMETAIDVEVSRNARYSTCIETEYGSSYSLRRCV